MLVSIINTSLVSVEESCEKLEETAARPLSYVPDAVQHGFGSLCVIPSMLYRQKSILMELIPDRPDLTDPVIANIDQDHSLFAVGPDFLRVSRLHQCWQLATFATGPAEASFPVERWLNAADSQAASLLVGGCKGVSQQ